MSADTASLFAQTRDEVMTPILPANANSVTQKVELETQGPQAAQLAANDGARLVDAANLTGMTLRDREQQIPVVQPAKQSLLGELGGQMAKMGNELLGPKEEPEVKAPAPMQPQSMPSITSGMSGPGGM